MENAQLKELLSLHKIPFKQHIAYDITNQQKSKIEFSINDKIKIFTRLFKGRSDVYALR